MKLLGLVLVVTTGNLFFQIGGRLVRDELTAFVILTIPDKKVKMFIRRFKQMKFFRELIVPLHQEKPCKRLNAAKIVGSKYSLN